MSGETSYVYVPEGLFYCCHYFTGATAAKNLHFEAADRVVKLRVAVRGDQAMPVWSNSHLCGWPDLFGHRLFDALDFLQKAFGRVPVLRQVFATEREYLSGLAAYSLFLSATEFAQQDATKLREQADSNGILFEPDAPPLFLLMRRTYIEEAHRLVRDGAIANQLFRNPKMPQGDLKELWPKWIQSSFRFLDARKALLTDVPKIILQPPL